MAKSINADSVSPKVKASSVSSAVSLVLGWLLTQVPFVASAPPEVQGAIVLLLVVAGTFAAGYAKGDPARF